MSPVRFALALHTASPDLGLAIAPLNPDATLDLTQVRTQVWPLGRDLSTHLHVHLGKFLPPQTWADLAFIAVAKGPGGFTGTRLGVVTARALAQQLGVPLLTVSTLAATAQQALPVSESTVAVQMRAQRGEVFGALYAVESGVGGLRVQAGDGGDRLFQEAEWQAYLAAQTTPYHLIQAEGGLGDAVTGVLALAGKAWQRGDRPDWAAAIPFYGQHPVTL
jgi:tRNA threonylcarbamoyl adenosine modification protein YeaZ